MTQFKLRATAPTNYQYQSLTHFGLPIQNYNGSLVAEKLFDTEEEAKQYLIERAEMYYDGNREGDEKNLEDAIERINLYGSLRLDAADSIIEEEEEEENEEQD